MSQTTPSRETVEAIIDTYFSTTIPQLEKKFKPYLNNYHRKSVEDSIKDATYSVAQHRFELLVNLEHYESELSHLDALVMVLSESNNGLSKETYDELISYLLVSLDNLLSDVTDLIHILSIKETP